MIFASISVAAFLFVIFKYFAKENIEPIFGVYKQPGKWYYLKYITFWCILNFRKFYNRHGSRLGQTGYGMKSRPTPEAMDVAQELSHHPKAFDAVFFVAANKEGYYFVGGSERRHNGIVNGSIYLAVPGKGLLCSSKNPSNVLHGAKINEFGAKGIRFTPLVPMKHWRVEYSGSMWYKNDASKASDVRIEGDWRSDIPHFDYDTDLGVGLMCKAIARENWSREYFRSLETAHQTHYEQVGHLKAKILIDGKEHLFEGQAFRDHSYGFKREWSLMRRYILHVMFLEDGTMASIPVICQPCTFSALEVGFLCKPDGTLHPLTWCDLQLYQHGENGTPPQDYAFSFKAGGKMYNVQVNVEHASTNFIGEDCAAKIIERFVRYNVNGINGRGISECHYRHDGGPVNS